MKRALKAYAVWTLGVLSAVALAWAYHRRLVNLDAPQTIVEEGQEEPAATADAQPD